MITGKCLDRRTFLRGAGAALALPFLDGMVPAFAGPDNSVSKPVRRLAVAYVPNGIIMGKWTPAAEGAAAPAEAPSPEAGDSTADAVVSVGASDNGAVAEPAV